MNRPTEHDIKTLGEAARRCWEAFHEDPEDPDALYEIVVVSSGYADISPDEDGTLTDSVWGLGFDEDGDLVSAPDWYYDNNEDAA